MTGENTDKGFPLLIKDIKNNLVGIILGLIYIFLSECVFKCVCPMKILTGVPCPGCGLTRAGCAVLTLHFKQAAYYNVMIYPVILIILYMIICRYILGIKPKYYIFLIVIAFVIGLFYYMIRLYYYFPNNEPMKYMSENLIRMIYMFFQR